TGHGALALEGAQVDLPADDPGQAALVGGGGEVQAPCPAGRAVREQGVGAGRSAVVGQRTQARVDGGVRAADQVAVAAVAGPGQRVVGDAHEVVAAGAADGTEDVRAVIGATVAGHDRILKI